VRKRLNGLKDSLKNAVGWEAARREAGTLSALNCGIPARLEESSE